jgi:hypothetical protein
MDREGYLHPSYIDSLSQYGMPRRLPNSGGCILERKIPDFDSLDAMGCYPLFFCQDWSGLHADLEIIKDHLVSLCLVTDPFGDYDVGYLKRCFKDQVVPFKQHFIVDLSRPLDSFISQHHRRYAHKSVDRLCIEKCGDPNRYLDDWTTLYSNLIVRHRIKGMLEFSRASFIKQFQVPEISIFRAVYKGGTVGMLLWYTQADKAYYHLGAYSDPGYKMRVSFPLFRFAIEYFKETGLCWLNLGAGAGAIKDDKDGLTRFKQGWSTGTKTAYICGKIFDYTKYEEVMQAKGVSDNFYFPCYRKGEFT